MKNKLIIQLVLTALLIVTPYIARVSPRYYSFMEDAFMGNYWIVTLTMVISLLVAIFLIEKNYK